MNRPAGYVVAGALGIAAVVAFVLGVGAGDDSAPDASAGPSTTAAASPVWSARRVPAVFVDAAASANLQGQVDELVAGTDACVLVDVAGRGTVARAGDGTTVVPASTQKVLTAAGALLVLGPDFRFTTRVVGSDPPADGTVQQLWLVGGGDPTLSTPQQIARLGADPDRAYTGVTDRVTKLETLADDIVRAGVRSVPGGIVGDGSAYPPATYVPNWPVGDRAQVGPLAALTVDHGVDPATGTVPDPALDAAAQLSALLTARGVAVGPPTSGAAPASAKPVAEISSVALPELVTEMLSASDNSTAEALALAVGREAGGQATTAAGLAGLTDALRTAGVDLTGVALVDGSGLAHDNRVTCPALVGALGLGSRPNLHSVVDGLAIAAQRGTLTPRFVGSPVAGRLHAKTGTLTGSAGLAGTFDPEDGAGSPTFAGVFNGGFSRARGYALTTALAEAIGAYPQSPPADELVPQP